MNQKYRTIDQYPAGKKVYKDLKNISTNNISQGFKNQYNLIDKENVRDINGKEKKNFYYEYIYGQKLREKHDNNFLIKKKLNLTSQNLKVEDINNQQSYTFKTKRITDPQNPTYLFKYDQSQIQKNPLVNHFLQQESQYLQYKPKQKNIMSKTQNLLNLDSKDLYQTPKYTFQSKRCTDPMNPTYKFNYQKSQINDNQISHYNDYQIPVFDFNKCQKKKIQSQSQKNFMRGILTRQQKNHQPEQRNQSREVYNILTGQ